MFHLSTVEVFIIMHHAIHAADGARGVDCACFFSLSGGNAVMPRVGWFSGRRWAAAALQRSVLVGKQCMRLSAVKGEDQLVVQLRGLAGSSVLCRPQF
jgi:hypothetical protein